MTDTTKKKLDSNMKLKWEKYVYHEITKGNKRNFRHVNEIIDSGLFSKVYMNTQFALWVFILCDGEYGFFDGYTWYEYIPKSIAEFMGKDVLNILQGNRFEEVNGRFFLK